MGNYTIDNFYQLADIILDTYNFEADYLHETVCEFYYGGEVPLFRLVYVEDTASIAVCFHVGLPKSDAFKLMDFIKSQMPKVKLSDEYIVDENGQTLVGQEAYLELERIIEDRAVPVQEIDYTPVGLVSYAVPHAIYHAQDPRSLQLKRQLKEKFRFYGKFTWEDR